jgi:hypothetical protein
MERDRNEILAAAEEFYQTHRIEVRRFNKQRDPETNKVIMETIEYRVPSHQEMFVAGVEWADTHPHWISVKDEKPFIGSAVMVAMEGSMEVETGFYGTDKVFRDSEGNKLDGVTHFMPFPRLPEGGEK